eukprot:scaffold68297_cov120-Phaeocystis_antarctica.AAC.4
MRGDGSGPRVEGLQVAAAERSALALGDTLPAEAPVCEVGCLEGAAYHVQLRRVRVEDARRVALEALEQPPVSHVLRHVGHQLLVEGVNVRPEPGGVEQALDRVGEAVRLLTAGRWTGGTTRPAWAAASQWPGHPGAPPTNRWTGAGLPAHSPGHVAAAPLCSETAAGRRPRCAEADQPRRTHRRWTRGRLPASRRPTCAHRLARRWEPCRCTFAAPPARVPAAVLRRTRPSLARCGQSTPFVHSDRVRSPSAGSRRCTAGPATGRAGRSARLSCPPCTRGRNAPRRSCFGAIRG